MEWACLEGGGLSKAACLSFSIGQYWSTSERGAYMSRGGPA